MTSSAGASGLTLVASPPRSRTASRIVARSTTQGTPVKSCISTRAGVNWISTLGSACGSQPPSARMCSAVMLAPSSVRSRFSSRIFRLYGRRSCPVHRVDLVDLVAGVAHAQLALRTEGVEAGHVALLRRDRRHWKVSRTARCAAVGSGGLLTKPYVRLVKPSSRALAVCRVPPIGRLGAAAMARCPCMRGNRAGWAASKRHEADGCARAGGCPRAGRLCQRRPGWRRGPAASVRVRAAERPPDLDGRTFLSVDGHRGDAGAADAASSCRSRTARWRPAPAATAWAGRTPWTAAR